ncbi:hypothetical protein EDC04DRAFT_2614053 [Pisolithus marmoratus]|nr:hypothetical protein EDC04DRAFT_2614053 [Pisolithus marmoratus]
MSHAKPSPNLPVKIGPPISVRRLQRIKGSTMPPTKVQPVKSCHQRIKEFRIPPLETRLKQGMNLAQLLGIQPSSCVQRDVLRKYLDSFHTKMVTLSNSQQLHPHVALQQLCAGVISKEDIVQDDDCDEDGNIPKSSPAPPADEHTPPDGDMDSETEEQAVEDAMEPVDEGNSVMDDRGNKPSGMNSMAFPPIQEVFPQTRANQKMKMPSWTLRTILQSPRESMRSQEMDTRTGIPQSASKRCTSSQESIDVIPPSLLTTRGVTAALTIEPLTFTTKRGVTTAAYKGMEGTIIALLNMYIETIPASGPMAMIRMMKTIIDIIAMQATKYPDDTATIGF